MIRSINAAFLIVALACFSPVFAADDLNFRLGPPNLIKVEWESALLDLADLNGDDRIDAVTVDNAKSLLTIYTQDGGKAPRKFQKREEVLEYPVISLAAGDLNGDGRADLALASPDRDIMIRLQTKEGALAPATPLSARGVVLRVRDMDRDGMADLVVMDKEQTSIFHGVKGKGVVGGAKATLYHAAVPGGTPALADFDGDGYDDMAFIDSQKRSRVLIRFQHASRQWGLQIPFETADSAEIVGVSQEGQRALLLSIDARSREIRGYRLDPAPAAQAGSEMGIDGPYFLTVDPQSHSERETLLPADVNGDGRTDLLLASPKAPETNLFLQDDKGRLRVMRAPSLFDIQSLAAVPREKGALVFALSGREQTIGAAEWEATRGLTVPDMLDFSGQPRAMAVADIDGSGKPDLLFLFAADGKAAQLAMFADPTSAGVVRGQPRTISLPDDVGKEEIEGMLAGDVNGDGWADLLAFRRYSNLLILLQKTDGSFETYNTSDGMKKSIFSRLAPGQLTLADLDGKAPLEMLIASQGLARAYRIASDGRLDMVEQFNGRDASARIASVTTANLDGQGAPEVVLLDSANRLLSIFRRGDDGVHTLVRHQEVDGLQGSRLLGADVNGDGRDDLLLYENARAQIFYSGEASARMNAIWRHAPDVEDGKYARLVPVVLLEGKPARRAAQLLALEGTENVLDIFRVGPADGEVFERFASFKMFDDEQSVGRKDGLGPRIEPRDMQAADVDGDGTPDLIVLMHDNIVYYMQRD